MTVYYYSLAVSAVSFLTACTALFFYLRVPAGWLCDAGESPGTEHLPENRCPHRKTALLLMTAVSSLAIMTSGSIHPDIPDIDLRRILFLSVVSLILFPAALCDADYCIIPDQSCLLALLTAFLTGIYTDGLAGCVTAAGGGLLSGTMMLLASLFTRLASGKEGIGMGDVKLLTACGSLAASAAGPGSWMSASCCVYVFSILSSAVWFAFLLLCRRARYGDARPLGPWIVLGSLLVAAIW